MVSWSAMIGGYGQGPCLEEAIRLFHEMLIEG